MALAYRFDAISQGPTPSHLPSWWICTAARIKFSLYWDHKVNKFSLTETKENRIPFSLSINGIGFGVYLYYQIPLSLSTS